MSETPIPPLTPPATLGWRLALLHLNAIAIGGGVRDAWRLCDA